MAFMKEDDAISGKHAKAFATINGQVQELFYAKKIDSKIAKKKAKVPVLGKTNVGNRAAGWDGTGTLTIYYVTSLFRKLMLDYVKTGKDFYFDLQIINEDPHSGIGRQTAVLKNCNLDEVSAAKFDAGSEDVLDEDMPFTFDDYDILDQFTTPTGA